MNQNFQQVIEEQIMGSPSGMTAIFVKLNDDWGIKMFVYESERDHCFEAQKHCSEKGWGPKVGEKIDLPEPIKRESGTCYREREFQYGYVTERLEVLPNICLDNGEAYKEQHGEEAHKEAQDVVKQWCDDNHDKKHDWVSQMRAETGYTFCDCHEFNWGKTKEGKWVPIDFGSVYKQ